MRMGRIWTPYLILLQTYYLSSKVSVTRHVVRQSPPYYSHCYYLAYNQRRCITAGDKLYDMKIALGAFTTIYANKLKSEHSDYKAPVAGIAEEPKDARIKQV